MLGIIGFGKMASAIALRLLEKRFFTPAEIIVFDCNPLRNKEAVHHQIKVASGIKELMDICDTCLLAVKPQDKEPVLNEISTTNKRRLIISLLAGVTTTYLEKRLGERPVIRVMPNLGIRVGAGITFFSPGRFAAPSDIKKALRIFQSLGDVFKIDEKRLNVITAISGSGPAYFFLLMEILSEFAIKYGVSKKIALKMVQKTALAASLLAEEEPFSALRAAVTSKGGTTEAAVKVLEKSGIRKIFYSALGAAVKRSQQLSRKG